MAIRFSSAAVTALINLAASGLAVSAGPVPAAGGGNQGLRILSVAPPSQNPLTTFPQEFLNPTTGQVGSTDAQVAALMNAGSQLITLPSNYPSGQYLLAIPTAYMSRLCVALGFTGLANQMPPSAPLIVTQEFAFNAPANLAAVFGQLGFSTNFTPTLGTPLPYVNA